ncbi:MAG: methyl-accepting chemotaxis protein [Pseudomonadota bacterium]
MKLLTSAGALGFEIVDVAGFFDRLSELSASQRHSVSELILETQTVMEKTDSVDFAGQGLSQAHEEAQAAAMRTISGVRASDQTAREVASWVHELSSRTSSIDDTLEAVRSNNQLIAGVARQVNILAINAKIEAARAGDLGRGFSVVANAINELSQQTSTAAVQISDSVDNLANWVLEIAEESQNIAAQAAEVIDKSTENDVNLTQLQATLKASQSQMSKIAEDIEQMRHAVARFGPSVTDIDGSIQETTEGIADARARTDRLVDISEEMVQSAAAAGGSTFDTPFITYVQSAAAQISQRFTEAVAKGEISEEALFDIAYTPIPNTNPKQFTTRFTEFTDQNLPEIQEAALAFDASVVFCAAVDLNGYLPTHNHKFSRPPSDDPVWNAAHCRNRRIFDDRVGLKAGRNVAPFLQQTYRRDMGGGEFAMMKDISAPIYVGERHWGGLRLAVHF